MEKEFVPYELAVKLKQLGFDEMCFCYFTREGNLSPKTSYSISLGVFQSDLHDTLTAAPIWQQSFDWFRGKHNLHGIIYRLDGDIEAWDYSINNGQFIDEDFADEPLRNHYDEARQACLEKLIEIIQP